jgi:hypothetical protein
MFYEFIEQNAGQRLGERAPAGDPLVLVEQSGSPGRHETALDLGTPPMEVQARGDFADTTVADP